MSCAQCTSILSPKSAAGSSEAGSNRGEEQNLVGVLVLACFRAAGDGQAFPRESYRVFD